METTAAAAITHIRIRPGFRSSQKVPSTTNISKSHWKCSASQWVRWPVASRQISPAAIAVLSNCSLLAIEGTPAITVASVATVSVTGMQVT
jgi:hypothetical protein